MKRFALVAILSVVLFAGYASAATTGVWRISRLGNVTLTQDGTSITGTYDYYGPTQKLAGTLEGETFTGWYFSSNVTSRCGPNNEWTNKLVLNFSADGRSVTTGDWGNCSDTRLYPSTLYSGTLQSGDQILFGQVDPGPPVTGSGPALGISANSQTEQLNITQNTPLSILIGLDQNNYASNADWWLVLLDAGTGEIYHYRFDGTWQEGLNMSYQGPISDLPDFEALNGTLYPGTYYFYFGVDTVANGQLDMDHLYYDFVQVNVQ